MKRVSDTIRLAAILLAGLMILSCETEIEYRGGDAEPKTVIYALLDPDSLISVSISESHSVFQTHWRPRQITNAVVELYRDDQLLETLTYREPLELPDYYFQPNPYSKYVSLTHKPQYGHTYRISARVPGFKEAYGETRLPDPVTITVADTSLKLLLVDGDISYKVYEMTLKLKIRDPDGVENYYKLSASALTGSYQGYPFEPYDPDASVGVFLSDISYMYQSDPLLFPNRNDDIFDMEEPNAYFIFSDDLISGKEYNVRCRRNVVLPDTSRKEFIYEWYRLSTLTKELYLYLKSYGAHEYTSDNFLVEPVPVYSNVVNGLGVVGAMSTTTDSIRRGDFPVEGVNYIYYFDDYRYRLKKTK